MVEVRGGGRHAEFNTRYLPEANPDLFDPEYLRKEGLLTETRDSGRGPVWFFRLDDRGFVLRHYRRGGRLAPLLADRYPWRHRNRTRPARESGLLRRMREAGLPVPAVAAWRTTRAGALAYRADIVTVEIPEAMALESVLVGRPLSTGDWRRLGATLRKFHDHQVDHADLNAANTLMDRAGAYHLVDFDRSQIRPGEAWKAGNLKRLRRSLRKQLRLRPEFHYEDSEFDLLLDGYAGEGNARARPDKHGESDRR